MPSGAGTHTHTHTLINIHKQNDFKKPGPREPGLKTTCHFVPQMIPNQLMYK